MDKNLKISKVNFTVASFRDPNARGPKRSFKPTVIYVYPEGETISENLANRRQRPNTTYKKLLKAHGLDKLNIPEGHKLAWNQKAGCECGCSPGFFIVDHEGYRVTLYGQLEGLALPGPIGDIQVAIQEVNEEAPPTTEPQV